MLDPPARRARHVRARAVRDVRQLVRAERPDDPGVQLERPLSHDRALHHLLHRSRLLRAPISAERRRTARQHRPLPAPAHAPDSGPPQGGHPVSTAAVDTHLVEPAESPLTPESWGKLGMWNFLAGDAMSFGGLLAAYGALRYGDPNWPLPSSILRITLTAGMTFLLVCSSV